MTPADLQRRGDIPGRNHDAARAQHRLGEEAGDVLRPDLQDLVLEFLDQMIAEGGHAHAFGPAIDVGCGDVMHPILDELQMRAAIAGLAGDGAGQIGAAVISAGPRDHVALRFLATPALVILDQAHRRIVGGRPPQVKKT
jgi:hypothetical protein